MATKAAGVVRKMVVRSGTYPVFANGRKTKATVFLREGQIVRTKKVEIQTPIGIATLVLALIGKKRVDVSGNVSSMGVSNPRKRRSISVRSKAVNVRKVSRNPVNVTLPNGKKVRAQSVVIGRTGAKVLILDKDMAGLKKRKANPKRKAVKKRAKKRVVKRTTKKRTTKKRTVTTKSNRRRTRR